jgi:oligopeptidase B
MRLPMNFDETVYNLSFIHIDTLKKSVRFKYESFITPEIYYDYNMETQQMTKLFETQVSNYNKSDYEMDFVYAPVHDGTQIPVTIIYNKNTPRDGTAPVFMSIRGDGEIDGVPYFIPGFFTFFDKGFYRVCPAIRGGGGGNSQREKDGSIHKGKNRAHDIASVSQYLINEKYTSAGKIHAVGGSGSGIALGMAANMYPEYFGSISLEVPSLDIIISGKDDAGANGRGNPNIKEEFESMIEYSPYQNVKKQDYPAMLIAIGLKDINVPAYESLKMVAKIRANNTGKAPIYLSTDLNGDHYRLNLNKILLPPIFILGIHYNILP